MHHRRAVWLFFLAIVLDQALGMGFGVVDNCGIWNGMYFAVVTVTTVGYGDVTPQGWEAHMFAVAIMLLIIPLWSAVFSFFTAGLTTAHVDKKHDELRQKLDGQD